MSRVGRLGHALYAGEVSYDFVGRRRRWYAISAIILLIAIASLATRHLSMGIEFEGGNVVTIPTATGTVEQAREVAAAAGAPDAIVTEFSSESGRSIQVQTPTLEGAKNQQLADDLAKAFGVNPDDVTASQISASWGSEITKKALVGLVVFIVLIAIFLSLYFEWRMAVAALIALIHDLVITIGIYSLVGFTVTPATVIGILTILGYSLYDTVVVFDKVKENTRGLAASSKMTYSQGANLAVNQTLVRSINTSIIALLPVGAILFVGPLLGASTLEDLSLALFVGIAAGTYSSIFIATPVLAQMKEREPAMKALAKRVAAREAAGKGASARGSARSAGVSPEPADLATNEGSDSDGSDGEAIDSEAGEPAAAAVAAKGVPPRPAGPRNQPRKGTSTKKRPANRKRR